MSNRPLQRVSENGRSTAEYAKYAVYLALLLGCVAIRMPKSRHFRRRFKRLRARQHAPMGNGADRARAPAQPADMATLTPGSSVDLLEYIADLVHELGIMAARAGHGRLAGLLEQAHAEARRRRGGQ